MENTRTMEMLDAPGVYGIQHGSTHSSSSTQDAERQSDGMTGLRASQACFACRKQKRKCDKQLPSCSLCLRMSRGCDYSDSTPTPSADDFAQLRQKVAELEGRLEAKNTPWGRTSTIADVSVQHNVNNSDPNVSVFPSMFLLDSEVFREARIEIPKPTVEIPQKIHSALGSITDMRDILDRHFENVHLWLPIVSKKRLDLLLEDPKLQLTADLALLFICMKLITRGGHESPQDAQSPLYGLSKRFASTVEMSGLMTLPLMQSNLLITAYELGHGIYPAAYLSSAHCARLGTLMGIHDRQHAPQILRKSGAWAEVEEIRRCWWATLLFDRYSNLGSEGASIVTNDPPPQTVLPADDTAWDQGTMASSEPLYVSSTTNVRAGAFARTCQVTHLMGRMLRNLTDHYSEPSPRFSEAIQLHRVTTALSNVLPLETFQDPLRYSTAMALCFGALLHVCEPFSCTESNRGNHSVEETEMQTIAIPGMREVAFKVLEFSKIIRETLDQTPAAVSPLVADCLYVATSTLQWCAYESGEEDALRGYSTLRETLGGLRKRWAVAGEYLKILDVMKATLYNGHPNL